MSIEVRNTAIVISDYEPGDAPYLEKKLSIWNEVTFTLEPKGLFYNAEKKELRIPRGVPIGFLEREISPEIEFDSSNDDTDIVIYQLKTEPRDDIQRRGISFLVGEGAFNRTKKFSQVSLNFDTGYGKTFVTIAALTYINNRAIIILNNNSLKKQWIKEFIDKTDLLESDICDIKGSVTINALLAGKVKQCKVYLVNHQTLSSYAKSNTWESIGEVFNFLKIGVKIYDESHLHFENTIKVDLFTNTKKTIYLTATFERSSYEENRVFETCFKNVVKYGMEERENVKKHIKCLTVFFNTKPDELDVANLTTRYSLDKNRYITYQMDNTLIFDVLESVLDKITEGKTLVLFSTIKAIDITTELLRDKYPNRSIGSYHSQLDEEYKAQNLNCDIIVSTPKSLGTGMDIDDLKYIINTEPYTSAVTASQIPGRLRSRGDDTSVYIELVDKGFKAIVNAYNKRLKHLKSKCVSITKYTYK